MAEKYKECKSGKRSASASDKDETPAKKSKYHIIDMIKNKLKGLSEKMCGVDKKLDDVKKEIIQMKEVGTRKKKQPIEKSKESDIYKVIDDSRNIEELEKILDRIEVIKKRKTLMIMLMGIIVISALMVPSPTGKTKAKLLKYTDIQKKNLKMNVTSSLGN